MRPAPTVIASAMLPTGTVTFLFTDIEGSTRLWESYPEIMAGALARHDALIREAIGANNGAVFKTVGDAFCAAFAAAPDAAAAAVDAQRSLSREPWPDNVTIRVRMALYAGTAQERDNDYFGPALSRVSRLLGAGHGGQTLVSAAAFELMRDHLPEGVALRDLGLHRLKDLDRAEQVYQISHPELRGEFPALKSLDYLPNNLPQQLTSFIGREVEMSRVRSMLGTSRLLTLTGSGGTGKTRLSLQTAAEVLEEYPDGVWLVELAPVSDPALVARVIASALNIKEQAGQSPEQSLIEYLQSKRLLLILDNCEHLIAECARLTTTLLRSCSEIRVLATSREPLGIAGEATYRVPSLSLPDPKQRSTVTARSLDQYESVRLFIERALLIRPDFVVTNQNAPALAQICHRVDGIPLALELAAARVRSLTVEEINTRLDSQFRLLTGGARSSLPRQQTLRALVDWSYDLLNDPEKTLLARLSVFVGGWTLPAAESICGFDPLEDVEVMDLLTHLVDKSLVLAEEDGETTRYRMLETLRQYAAEKNGAAGEAGTVRDQHRDWFLALVEEAEPNLTRSEMIPWLTRLETEHDNLRAALDWSATNAGREGGESGLRLAGALSRFWEVRGYFAEGRRHLENALGQTRSITAASAKALGGLGILAQHQGDLAVADSLHNESLAINRQLGGKQGIATSLTYSGNVAHQRGDYTLAWSRYEESLGLHRELGHEFGIAASLGNLGNVANEKGDNVAARSLYEESLALRRNLGDERGVAYTLNNLGIIAEEQRDLITARSLYEESLSIYRRLGDKQRTAYSLSNLSGIAYYRGDYESAQLLQEDSLSLFQELGDKRGIAGSLHNLGLFAHARGDLVSAMAQQKESVSLFLRLGDKRNVASSLESVAALFLSESQERKAAVLWAATAALRENLGSPLSPGDKAEYEQKLNQTRLNLGEEVFAGAWEEGRSLTWEQAVDYALGVRVE